MSSHDLVTKTSSASTTPNGGSTDSSTSRSQMITVKSPHNTSVAAELSAATDLAGIYCSVDCKYGRRDAKDMVRCSLCYTWYNEDCVDNHYNHTTDSHWWLCRNCRQMPNTLVTLNDTVLQLSGYVSQLVDQNKILTEMVNKLKQSKSNIKAELTSIQKSKDLDRNPHVISSDKPSVILGDSTIRDVVPHEERHLYVCSKGGAKFDDSQFINDLMQVPFHIAELFYDIHD